MNKVQVGQWHYHSQEELTKIAPLVLKKLSPGKVLLEGPVGAGKTTFVQYAASFLSITEPVLSPTYQIMNLYQDGQIAHLDLYRLTSPQELEPLGIDELEARWLFIEWGLAFEDFLQPLSGLIQMTILDDHSRLITLLTYDSPTH